MPYILRIIAEINNLQHLILAKGVVATCRSDMKWRNDEHSEIANGPPHMNFQEFQFWDFLK